MSQEANLTFSHSLGERLKKARQALRLTQDDLAKRWDFSGGNYIYMLESGQKSFPLKLVGLLEGLEREVRAKVRDVESGALTLEDETAPSSEQLWRKRAVAAEKKLADLRSGLRSLLDLSGDLAPPPERKGTGGLSSISPSEVEASVAGAEHAIELERRVSSRKSGAGETSEHKSAPSGGASPEPKGKPLPPKPAPE